jgi:hypothetical protein
MPDSKSEAEHGEYVVEAGAYSTQDGACRRVDTALTRAMPAVEEVKEAAPYTVVNAGSGAMLNDAVQRLL